MNKKLLVVSILAVFMLVAISFASAVSTQTASATKKESPLFRVRARRAIGERLKDLRENIKSRFIRERIFSLPPQWLRNHQQNGEQMLLTFGKYCTVRTSVPDPCCQ